MYGQLSPDQRRTMGSVYWSRPMWGYQVLILAGLGLALATNLVILFELSSAPGGAANYVGLYILAIAGGVVAVVGLVLRRLTLNEMAVTACPKCGQLNLQASIFCRKCGTRLEEIRGPETSPPSTPPSETR